MYAFNYSVNINKIVESKKLFGNYFANYLIFSKLVAAKAMVNIADINAVPISLATPAK